MNTEKSLRTLKRVVFRHLFMKLFLEELTILVFVFSGLAFLWRANTWDVTTMWALLMLSILGLGLRNGFRAHGKMPTDPAFLATLDRHNTSGGLLMAEREASLGNWQVSAPEVPKVSGFNREDAWRPLGALAFLAVMFVIPMDWIHAQTKTNIPVAGELAELEMGIETLEELGLLEKEEAEDMQETIENLRDEGLMDASSWDALDSLEEQLAKRTESAEGETTEAASRLEALQNALEMVNNEGDAKLQEQAMQELLNLSGSQDIAELADHLSENSLNEAMSPEQMSQGMKEAMRQAAQALSKKEQALSKIGKKIGNKPGGNGNTKKTNGKASKLLDMIDAYESNGGQCNSLKQCAGRGGWGTEGGGSADLTWKDPDAHEDGSWKPLGLDTEDGDESVLLGTRTMAPTENTEGEASFKRHLKVGQAGSANRHKVLPQHRKTVKRFFSDEP